MKPTWVLVCGRDGARLFDRSRGEKTMRLVRAFSHPEGRLKEGEIVTDKAGRNFHRTDKISHSGGKSGDPRAHIDTLFAEELAQYLKKGHESSQFGRLYLVASPHFMGILKKNMDSETIKTVNGMIEKDLCHFSEKDVNQALAGQIYP